MREVGMLFIDLLKLLWFSLVFYCFGTSVLLMETLEVLLGSPAGIPASSTHSSIILCIFLICALSPSRVKDKCAGTKGVPKEGRTEGWQQDYSDTAPPPHQPPPQRPQVSCPIWDHLSLDEMNMLSACVKFRKEFRDRYSKHYLPCARWEATIDWRTPIIVEECVKLNGKKEEKKDCLHELKPSSTAYCDDHKAAKH